MDEALLVWNLAYNSIVVLFFLDSYVAIFINTEKTKADILKFCFQSFLLF